jgi:hypothetical protein
MSVEANAEGQLISKKTCDQPTLSAIALKNRRVTRKTRGKIDNTIPMLAKFTLLANNRSGINRVRAPETK